MYKFKNEECLKMFSVWLPSGGKREQKSASKANKITSKQQSMRPKNTIVFHVFPKREP